MDTTTTTIDNTNSTNNISFISPSCHRLQQLNIQYTKFFMITRNYFSRITIHSILAEGFFFGSGGGGRKGKQ